MTGTVGCDQCGEVHVAEFSHISQYGGHRVFAAVCPTDWLVDYYTEEGVTLDA